LNDLWFGLFVIIIAGYLILDGFDMGVGILHLVTARSDVERRLVLNSVGPIWDGNEVWLVVGGGVLFGAFPFVYAALFSGFYWAMMLVLLVLILRTVAIEFRGKRTEPGWRATWDVIFSVASAVLALLLGVAFGNIISGVPVNQQGEVHIGSLLELLHPFALWFGLTTLVMLGLHGALYLHVKTEGEVQRRVRAFIPWLFLAFAATAVVAAVWMAAAGYGAAESYVHHPLLVIFPLAALLAFGLSAGSLLRDRDVGSFFWSAATIALLLISLAAGLYPNLLTSSISSQFDMTVTNAAAAPETLTVMLIVAVIGMPFVLLYTAGVQYLFRGKVKLSAHSY
jgi:cytochrome d ubiquinol oxidase subunit II